MDSDPDVEVITPRFELVEERDTSSRNLDREGQGEVHSLIDEENLVDNNENNPQAEISNDNEV